MAEATLETEAIIKKVQSLYADAMVEVAGEGCNLELLVISDGFQSMPVMKRQQSLLKLFSDDLTSGRLHALTIKAKSRAEMNAAKSHFVQLEI
ncbi:BolA/IbaG family iron-sulfur metabolism protein [Mariprofundus ferrooxydans]|uniref:BolA/IbaG family iron-sulfur metabolism protein n=1 Tax=Mariprofundus ferrooxydans TaxID=314344 RepID=UPI00036A1A8E|nr:BolA/IbaG family iron-sulfur metabolism protein [Mariprofundus ferrooxydans]